MNKTEKKCKKKIIKNGREMVRTSTFIISLGIFVFSRKVNIVFGWQSDYKAPAPMSSSSVEFLIISLPLIILAQHSLSVRSTWRVFFLLFKGPFFSLILFISSLTFSLKCSRRTNMKTIFSGMMNGCKICNDLRSF